MANVIKHKRGSGSDPAANNLVLGELAIRTDTGKLFTKMDSGAIAEIAGGGSDIAINTLSSSSGTGGGSATFNGSAYRFTLSAPPSVSAAQLLVSINGVIQKPVAGTGQPSEGFSVDGTDIILGDAPATGSDFFILTFKSLGVSEPADNSVTSAKIVDGAIVNADINASAAIAGTKISPDFGSQNIVTTGTLTINTNDLIVDSSGRLLLGTTTEGRSTADHLTIASAGHTGMTIRSGTSSGGNISFSDGTSGDDENRGLISYDHAANFLRFFTNAAERLRIDSSGNVGIGTSSPSTTLNVTGTAAQAGIFQSNQSATTVSVLDTDGDGLNISGGSTYGHRIHTNNTENLELGVNNSTKLLIDSSGNVGIGTTSPDNTLHLVYDDSQTYNTDIRNAGLQIENTNSTVDTYAQLHLRANNSDVYLRAIRQASNQTDLAFLIDNGGSTGDAGEVMRLTDDERVGIGTSSPAGKLHISSGTSDDCKLIIESDTDNDNEADNPSLVFRQDGGLDVSAIGQNFSGTTGTGNNQLFIANSVSSGGILFCTGTSNGFTNASERMRIDSSGRLLIAKGTASTTTSQIQIGDPSSGYTWDVGDVPQILIAGLNNESPTSGTLNIALRVADENNNNMFQIHNRGGGNTDVGEVYMGGKVGIGITNPAKPLDIYKSGTNQSDMYVRNATVNYKVQTMSDQAQAGTETNHPFYAISNNQYVARFDGDGIKFGSDTAAANALDDYEEGTWTPAISGVSYNDAQGTYIKIGTQCFVTLSINQSNTSKSGDTRITGLPFTAKSGSGEYYPANSIPFFEVSGISLSSGYNNIYGRIDYQQSNLQLLITDGVSHGTLTAGSGTTLNSNHTLRTSFTYQTA